jgi:hypothetical protein
MICDFIGMGYFRQSRKKDAKDQVAAAYSKLDEFEFSNYNISAVEFEEEEDIYKKDKSSSILDIVSADIENDDPSETDWEDEDIEEDEMETVECLDPDIQTAPKLTGYISMLSIGIKFIVNMPRFVENMQGILRRNARQVSPNAISWEIVRFSSVSCVSWYSRVPQLLPCVSLVP